MIVGLLTHHWPPNFGANLQAFSTVRALEQMGHTVYVLNYRPSGMVAHYKNITKSQQINQHELFIDTYMTETRICTNQEDLLTVSRELQLDCVICGSDAVIRLQKNTDREDLKFPNPFWLSWVDEGVRVGFLAASCMGSQYFTLPKNIRRSIASAVKRLDYCSVRDKWSRWMLQSCGVPSAHVKHCPDPVVGIHGALDGIDTSRPDGADDDYILMSIYPDMLSAGWVEEFVADANKRGFKVFGFPQPDVDVQGSYNKIIKLPMSPLDWYRWIANASGYVGVRFHPVMLSQVNAIPYVALDAYDTGLRFKKFLPRAIARLIKPFTRLCSKTYDTSKRVAKQRYCIPIRKVEQTKPSKVMDMLEEQQNKTKEGEYNSSMEKKYIDTLKKILGGNYKN